MPFFTRASLFVLAVGALALPSPGHAGEGQWRPAQLDAIPKDRTQGLELKSTDLWKGGDERTGGLLRAAVNLSGCSAAFVSPDGLIAINHHCAYSALQANSTPDVDYITQGFLAKDRTAELPATGKTVRIVRSISDVTDRVRAPEALRDLRWTIEDCKRGKDPKTKDYCGCAGRIAALLDSKDAKGKDLGPYPDFFLATAPRFQRCQRSTGARPVAKLRTEPTDDLIAREAARERQIKKIVDSCNGLPAPAIRWRS